VQDLSDRRFAVVVDEAHSSQSGRSAGNLRGVLSGALGNPDLSEEERLEQAEKAEAESGEPQTTEDLIVAEARSRGPQRNLSFYAFTATPKAKTLELFGVPDEAGLPQPFHLYSMRQAIEEGFILDVLKNYTTYKTYFKLSKAIEDDPDVDERKAKRAIARFMSLHPHNIAQKTEIMVEHFRRFTRHKIGGKAKAMVVTRSRLHAVRYRQAFDRYLEEKGYDDIGVLVAFSGTVEDPEAPDLTYTEAGMNGFSETELPGRFGSPEFHVLIVAEKYQTGFDQPLLHTMFVDKKLEGLHAVQTLSRLNRTTSGKIDTFVLDFVNEVEEIRDAFKFYYEATELAEPTDPNQVYTLQTKLWEGPVLRQDEIDEFAAIYFKPRGKQDRRDHGKLNRWIDPSVERFRQTYRDVLAPSGEERFTEEGEEFRSTLQGFVRLYSFLSQIIDWQDVDLEKLYAFGRHLLMKLPHRGSGGMLELDDEVALQSYRVEKTYEGSAALAAGDTATIYGPKEVGTGKVREDHQAPLSEIIEVINQRFGTNWKAEDVLFMEAVSGDMLQDEALAEQARVNTMEQFEKVFTPAAMRAVVSRRDRNEEIVGAFMEDAEIRDIVIKALMRDVYERARA